MNNIIKETFTLTLQYEMEVDTSTGELLNTKLIKRSVDKANFRVVDSEPKIQRNESSNPELNLEDNKYYLNTAAITLMNVTADDKLEIKYEKLEKGVCPVIGTEKSFGTKGGNKLNKNNTVAFRGNKNAELSKYGPAFSVIPHPSKEGLFILKSTSEMPVQEVVEDEDISFPDNIDLSDLIDTEDDNSTEISSDFFKL